MIKGRIKSCVIRIIEIRNFLQETEANASKCVDILLRWEYNLCRLVGGMLIIVEVQ